MRHLLNISVIGLFFAATLISSASAATDTSPDSTQINLPPMEQALDGGWKSVPTKTISTGGVDFAYRELGKRNGGTPVVFLTHLAAVLDNWDPRVVDGFAATHYVVAFDNRGVGASSGSPSNSIEQMADDAIAFIKAMGFDQVDLFGFSMGGMVAQQIALKEPRLVRKMILAGTGPAGEAGISSVSGVTFYVSRQ